MIQGLEVSGLGRITHLTVACVLWFRVYDLGYGLGFRAFRTPDSAQRMERTTHT
jgi:hypothetical protein